MASEGAIRLVTITSPVLIAGSMLPDMTVNDLLPSAAATARVHDDDHGDGGQCPEDGHAHGRSAVPAAVMCFAIPR